MHITRRAAARAIVVLLAAAPLTGCSYNRFVTQQEAIKGQWAEVENQLQRRNDLIPNLVQTVKGYAQHEESVYKDIADARAQLLAAKSPEETISAANRERPRSAGCSPSWRTTRSSRRTSSSIG